MGDLISNSDSWDKKEKRNGKIKDGISIEGFTLRAPELLVVHFGKDGTVYDLTTELLGPAKRNLYDIAGTPTYVKGGTERCAGCGYPYARETSMELENLAEGEETEVKCVACGSTAAFHRKNIPFQPDKAMAFLEKYMRKR